MDLREKIIRKIARVGIIGLGYVGLPLAIEYAKAGFKVLGIEIDEGRVKKVNGGKSYVLDVAEEELERLVLEGKLRATSDYSLLKELETINICVPTPLRKTKEPDISYIVSAVEQIKRYLRREQLIILESTTYPGTTEEVVRPALESTGLRVGRDFYLAFSPERVDPGNKVYTTKNTPKVVGGVTKECTEMAKLFYEQVIGRVIPVSSPIVAEMVKLLENTYRSVNIGLVNELALLCDRLQVDVWEVIEAAATKPFGFMPFYPGPGLGGHCIPVDPFYLSWKAKTYGFNTRFIELAGEINGSMPGYVVSKIADALNDNYKSIKGAKILLLGVAYKKDINDIRESPAIEIIKLLQNKGAQIFYNDPYVPLLKVENIKFESLPLNGVLLSSMDCIVVTTAHSLYNYQEIVDYASLVIDTRNATKGCSPGRARIVKI